MSDALCYTPVGAHEELLSRHFTTVYPEGFVRCEGMLLPASYRRVAQEILSLEVRDDDVWVCSFPKTGTTWTQEMVWCIGNDLDFEGAKVQHEVRFPFLDLEFLVDGVRFLPQQQQNGEQSQTSTYEMPRFVVNSIGYIKDAPSPRYIKTHLPFQLLPLQLQRGETGAKIVYVVRNAKDTCISYFHHVKLFESYTGDFDDFVTLFLNDSLVDAPFWKHALGYWEKRHSKNTLFLKFEEMKKDMHAVIRKTAKFLGKDINDDQLVQLSDHLSFEKMKKNPAVNFEDHIRMLKDLGLGDKSGTFMRNGQVDQWKTNWSQELVQRFDLWTEEQLRGTGLYY